MSAVPAAWVRLALYVVCTALLLTLVLSGLAPLLPQGGPAALPFQNPALPLEARVNDLVGRMTLAEKVAQMQQDAPAIPRLGVPAYHWWNEALHGVARNGPATVFPQAIALAATFNPELHEQIATVISTEARAKHHEALRHDQHGMNTGLDFWSPNVNIFRDPRWGRGQETYGEDPFLTARMGVAFIKGMQGDDPKYFKTIATPKHFAVHSGPDPERHRLDVHPTPADLYGTYLPAFEACIREGRAYSVMGAYNRVNGEPCCASTFLLDDLLRKQWGFEGYVVSDVDAIFDIYANHQVAATAEEASARAVQAGCDLNGGQTYGSLVGAVRMGLLAEADIDRSVKRLMTARFKLGMFDPPEMVPYAQIPLTFNDAPANEALALKAARQSIVLLKNQGGALPLKENLGTLAVIGPQADSLSVLQANYNGTPAQPVTILQGLRDAAGPGTRVLYEPGCPRVEELLPLDEPIPAACLFADADLTQPGLWAEYFDNINFTGAPILRRIDAAVDFDFGKRPPRVDFPREYFAVRWTGFLVAPETGTYQIGGTVDDGFALELDGVPLVEDWAYGGRRSSGARVMLEKGHAYELRLWYFQGKDDAVMQLKWSRPRFEPFYAQAVRTAQAADAVVLVLGLDPDLEGEEMPVDYRGFFGGDRTTLDLPAVQEELLEAVAATGKPIVLVLTSGSALAVNWAQDHVPAIVQAWYPGEQGGRALAEVLWGKVNPSGRLPITFYHSVQDLPPFADYRMTAGPGRTYRYFTGEPLYPFGYGLSYTSFAYQDLRLTGATTKDNVGVQVKVRNAGERAGDEVVQVYVTRPGVAYPAPLRSLAGFARVSLEPGEEKTVVFTLTPYQTGVVNPAGQRVNPAGEVKVQVGAYAGSGLTGIAQLRGEEVEATYAYVPPRVSSKP